MDAPAVSRRRAKNLSLPLHSKRYLVKLVNGLRSPSNLASRKQAQAGEGTRCSVTSWRAERPKTAKAREESPKNACTAAKDKGHACQGSYNHDARELRAAWAAVLPHANNLQLTTCHLQLANNLLLTICNLQFPTCNMQLR